MGTRPKRGVLGPPPGPNGRPVGLSTAAMDLWRRNRIARHRCAYCGTRPGDVATCGNCGAPIPDLFPDPPAVEPEPLPVAEPDHMWR